MTSNNGNYDPLAERARSLRAEGAIYKQIKAELGIGSLTTISRMLGVAGAGPPRPRIATEVRERARELRHEGKSVPEISRELGLARSTAWLITKDIAWTPGPEGASRRAEAGRRYWEAQRERRDADRKRVQTSAVESVGDLSDRELLLLGTVLYWAEGAKSKPWSRREQLDFINSDPNVILLFLAWLDLLGVRPERLTYRLSIHESADIAAAEQYWADIVGVPASSFRSTTLKRHEPRTSRKNVGDSYRGCLVVRVRKSAPEYWRMDGLWSGVASAIRRRGTLATEQQELNGPG